MCLLLEYFDDVHSTRINKIISTLIVFQVIVIRTYSIVTLLPFIEIPGFWYDQEKNRYYRITSNPAQSPSGVSLADKAKHKLKVKSNNEGRTLQSMDSTNVTMTIEMAHCPLLEKLQRSACNDGGIDMTKLLILREYQHTGLTQRKR